MNALRQFLEIIRDYGMPTVAFGSGIYAFLMLLKSNLAPEIQLAVAIVLSLTGLLSQMWIYARTNPRIQSDEVNEQLSRMTSLVEKLALLALRDSQESDEKNSER